MQQELSLKYVQLDRSELSSTSVKNYLSSMSDNFIPPLNKKVDINSYSEKLVQNADCFFIQSPEKNIGFFAVYTNDYSKKIAFISSISIIPEYQGTGVSTKIINFITGHSRKKGMTCIKLEVNINNCKAIRFYNNNSFEVSSINHEIILMNKDISV